MHLKSLYPPVPSVPDKNVHELIFRSRTATMPDYVAHIDVISGEMRTRQEVEERVRDAATALGAPVSEGGLGLSSENGDVVGICSCNSLDYVTLLQACLVITTPFSLISSYSTHFELVHALRLSNVTRVFVQSSSLSRMLSAAKEVGLSEDSVYILEDRNYNGRKRLEDIIANVRQKSIRRVPIKPANKSTLAYFVFSSGTTGLPKAVMISHGNIWFTVISGLMITQEEVKITKFVPEKPPVVLAVLPFHHTFGLQMFCIRCVIDYNTLVVVPKWDPRVVLAAIPKYKINVISLVPSFLHQMVSLGLLEKADFSSVWTVTSGAAYLPSEVEEKFISLVHHIPRVAQGYGLSECTLSAIRKPIPGILGGCQPLRGSAGILLPGMESRIVRPDGSEADFDEPGELWLKGENIALGYYQNDKATRETFVDGWLRTGDTFKVDEKQNYFFVDRAKDTLKISGVQVSPTEIEEVLHMHPDKLLADVCVAGVSGGRTSDEKIPRAWLVLSEEGKKRGVARTMGELNTWTHQNLSKYKWLRGGMEIVDQIPKSPTGKVLRRQLQDRYEESRQLTNKAKL